MKIITYFTAAIISTSCVYIAHAEEKSVESITAESLNTISVIGEIGVPLGTVATVKATVTDGDSLQMKYYQGKYILKITEVNGVKLASEPMVEFSLAPGVEVKLANDNFELYEMKTGEKAKSLTGEQTEDLKKDYVGSTIMLQVYELGYYSGIPDNMPKEVEIWQDTGFRFSTYLRVLREVVQK